MSTRTKGRARGRRRAGHTLVVALALVLPLGLGGCSEDYCKANVEDPLVALWVGLVCYSGKPRKAPNDAPKASFVADPVRVQHGGTVTLNASASQDPDGKITKYEWDIDGLPGPDSFEIETTEPVIQRQLFSLNASLSDEVRSIGLRVTDSRGATAEAHRQITITGVPAPAAAFTITPNPAFVGQSVFFDASSSTGAAFYSWDLDGDSVFELGPTREDTTARTYTTPGTRTVRLRAMGLLPPISDEATMNLSVVAAAGASARASARRARGKRFSARLDAASLPRELGKPVRRGSVTTFKALTVRGRLTARKQALGPLLRFRRSRWVARLKPAVNERTNRASLAGIALARFPRGAGRACMRISMALSPGRAPAGRLTLLGGSGPAARLAGGARFTFRLDGDRIRVKGRLGARIATQRKLPRSCASLAHT